MFPALLMGRKALHKWKRTNINMYIASISQDPSIERKIMKEVPIRKVH